MGIIDWLMLAFLLYALIMGWRRGLAGALIKLAGLVATFFLVSHYYPLVSSNLMLKYHMGKGWASVLAVVLIALLIAVVARLVIYFCNRVLKLMKLSFANKLLGMIFGFVNGLLILIILTVVLDFFPKVSAPLKNSSRHRAYAGVNLLKDELFEKLNLKQKLKHLELLDNKDKQADKAKR
ncbi:MAG: CvpA family protein [Candidatus Cloacimonadaceae bacterium]|nr:CvpA family protein [Actinomycetota bacterium]MDZ4182437.1 CvpA family protein [Candidatus Cloacimonadaceae bacterium]